MICSLRRKLRMPWGSSGEVRGGKGAGRQEGVADALARGTFLEKWSCAHRAGVGFVNAWAWGLRHLQFLEAGARPEQMFQRSATDGVVADGTEKMFVGFAILFEQPV